MLIRKYFSWLRDFKIKLKSDYFKLMNRSSFFSDKTILFKKIRINNSTVGRYTYFAGSGVVNNASIGSFCSIADGVRIGLGIHPIDWVSTHPATYSDSTIFPFRLFKRSSLHAESKQVTIGHDVWLGLNVIILDGVTIGNGVIIAAGSVVTKDIPDYNIVAGVPAKIIKTRPFIEKVNGIDWWDLDDKILKEYLIRHDNNAAL